MTTPSTDPTPSTADPDHGTRGRRLTRSAFAVLRIAAALAALAAISTQVTDQLLNDVFTPTEYFSYFTIQTTLMHMVVLSVGGVFALRHPLDTPLLTAVRMCMVTYATVTGTVYAVLLRGIPQEGFIGIQWPNEVIHVYLPLVVAADWLLAPGRRRLPWRRLWTAVAYPLAWVGFTLVRGSLTGWFPYPFLQPGQPGGWPSVGGYIVGIAAFVVAVGSVAILISRSEPASGRTVRAAPR